MIYHSECIALTQWPFHMYAFVAPYIPQNLVEFILDI